MDFLTCWVYIKAFTCLFLWHRSWISGSSISRGNMLYEQRRSRFSSPLTSVPESPSKSKHEKGSSPPTHSPETRSLILFLPFLLFDKMEVVKMFCSPAGNEKQNLCRYCFSERSGTLLRGKCKCADCPLNLRTFFVECLYCDIIRVPCHQGIKEV